jgi:hypothetical protein
MGHWLGRVAGIVLAVSGILMLAGAVGNS